MDPTQILLSITLTITTIFLIVIGVELVLVFRELRKTLKKTNDIVEGFEKMGTGLEHNLNEFLGFFGGVKTFFKVIENIKRKRDERRQESET